MAKLTGTFQTYQQIGIREDLSDMIYDISPVETPFMSNVKRTKATNTLHEWQTDALAAATADNITIEGDEATYNTASATTRFGNYTQISDKIPIVSRTSDAVNTAGRRREMAYQIMKRGKELKRDIEKRLCSSQGAVIGTAATGRECAGVGRWLWNNQVKTGGATATTVTVASGVPTVDSTASGIAGTFLEADLKACLSACWDDGGNPTMVLCGSWNKQKASAFSGIATLYRDTAPDMGQASIIGAADVYVGDFSTVNIVPSRFTETDEVYVLDVDYWKVAYLDPIQQTTLAKTGHADKRMIWAEYTLEACNPLSSGKVYTTTTS